MGCCSVLQQDWFSSALAQGNSQGSGVGSVYRNGYCIVFGYGYVALNSDHRFPFEILVNCCLSQVACRSACRSVNHVKKRGATR